MALQKCHVSLSKISMVYVFLGQKGLKKSQIGILQTEEMKLRFLLWYCDDVTIISMIHQWH